VPRVPDDASENFRLLGRMKKIRRARSLVMAWLDGRLVFTNYLTQISASAEPETARILHFFDGWAEPSQLFSSMPEYSPRSLLAGIRDLLRNTFLLKEGTAEAERDADMERVWSGWLPHGSFHFGTKDVEFLSLEQTGRLMKRYMAESPQPPLIKKYPKAAVVSLPSAHGKSKDGEFTRVLMARRTHRDFSLKPLSQDAISRLLYYTWGVTGTLEAPPFGQLFHKTSPSGGARHPGEVYLLALRVEGLARGLYHYDGLHHRLKKIRRVDAAKKAVEYSAGHEFLQQAAAVFIMTAVFPRVLWKYRFARAYRVVLLDAGHLCQTFCLVATWLGLAPFCTAALKDSLIERDLGIDGIREAPLYLAAVGVPPDGKLRNRR
jgi:SagB-type dehydrogenase family enzyme